MKIPQQYFLSPLFIFLFILFACENLYAKWATTAPLSRVHQVDGPVDASDLNQKILKIVMSSTAPLGTSTITALNFNLTGNNEISTIKIVYTSAANDSNFTNATNQFGGIITNPGASISFSGSYTAPTANGLFFFWLVCDAKAAIANGFVIDASLTSFTGGSAPTWENGVTPINPTGFRLTGRNYTIGTGESYPTIRETANGISRFDYDGTDNIFMELTANYANPAESGSSISFLNHTGPANIIIRPQTGQTGKITGGDPGSAVAFMGFQKAQKIILDGRPGGVDPANPDDRWTIRNARTAVTVGITLYFSDDADFNSFQYLNIEGEVSPAQSGIVVIYTTVAPTGNDNISFKNCIIRDWAGSSALPYGGIVSIGTAGKPNTNITIDSCRFVNIFNPASLGSSCINVNTNSDLFTITNNHFFQTAAYSALNNDYFVIDILTGSGHTVTGNFIGGTGINCSGTPFTVTSGTAALIGMRFNTSGTPPVIENNTVANINYTTASITLSYKIIGIVSQGTANYTIGSSGKGNTIGSMTTTGNISITNTASGSYGFAGIRNSSTGTVNIAYNKIGGITVGASVGINNNQSLMISKTAGTVTIDNNTIGGTVANSITQSSNAALYGINNSDAGGMTVTNNTIQNFNHSGGTGTDCNGIVNGDGPLTATGNTIKNFTLYANVNNYSIFHSPATSAIATINNNSIQDISSTNTGTSAAYLGIVIQTGSAVTCNGNTIGSAVTGNISLSGNSLNYGIYKNGTGTLTCNTNIVQGFNLNNDGATVEFRAISSEGGASGGTLSASGNLIRDISVSSTKVGRTFSGIYIFSNAASNVITKCTIEDLRMSPVVTSSSIVQGIYVLGTGGGKVTKNSIKNISSVAFSGGRILGITNDNTGNWEISNNAILIDNSPNTGNIVIMGIEGLPGVGYTTTTYHNSVKVYGTVAAGTGNTMSYYAGGSGNHIVKNNLFQNLRMGGTGKHYAEYNSNLPASYITDYNYLENDASQSANIASWTSDYNFVGWQGAPANAANSKNGTITLDVIGKVTTNPFIGAGTGTNLTSTVADDKIDITRGIASWMGAYEGQNITTSAISPLAYCAGGAIGVSYTVGGNGSFNGGNIFTAQLSNSAGDFSSPTNIGTLTSTTPGTIAATIPGATPAGSGYRIRVVSSDPVITGSGNGADINIQTAAPSVPTANAASAVTCSGFTANWTASAGAASYLLSVATDAVFTSIVAGYNNLDVGNVSSKAVTGLIAATTYYYRLKATNGCGISAVSNTISQLTSGTGQGTYVVTSTANGTTTDGVSLRWAITQTNANCGHDIIRFNLGAAIPYTISLTTLLPNLTDNDGVTIDGFENGFNDGIPNSVAVFNAATATPLNPSYAVVLGNSNIATGLVLASNNNVIKGLVLQDFGDGTLSANDIAITISGNNNQILGCYIGMDAGGTTKGTKTAIGVSITGNNNQIGDGTAAGANLISGMNGSSAGVEIYGAQNTIKGNLIGLQKDGTTIVSGNLQRFGVRINTASSQNIIGGINSGDGNVLSGNNHTASGHGIYIMSTSSLGNSVIGNIIGSQANGTTLVTSSTQTNGIVIDNSPNNIIGGSSLNERNIISANDTYGVVFYGPGTTGNVLKGNYIGIDKNGTTFITGSTQDYGVYIWTDASGNTIGGSGAGEGNVISGNSNGGTLGTGIYFTSTATAGNTVLGNIIGPQADGITYLASNVQYRGIDINGSPNNTIGGSTAGARNIISANEAVGVQISGASTTGNVVKGNYIGIDKNGTTFITGSTQDYGVYIISSAASNTIGGSGAGEGNVISGNKDATNLGTGIYTNSTAAAGNTILGNIIGPQADGVTYLASNGQFRGIEINSSPNNTIGGNTAGARNIISANEDYGVYITGAGTTGNVVKGNYIGIDKNGTTFITGSTQDYGVYITSSAASNIIGGNGTGEGNVISANQIPALTGYGVYLGSSAAAGNIVIGNIIGPQADGISNLTGNNDQSNGVYISNSPNNIIGGNSAGARNIISANQVYGVFITGASSTGNIVKGNYIGIDKTGTTFITGSTQDYGVYITTSAASNTIGGSGAGEGNVISGNKLSAADGYGVFLGSTATTGNTVLGNIIGPQADGLTYLASNAQFYGVYISGSPNNTIGGNTALARNIISANESAGVFIALLASSGNVVKGNYIGIAQNGTTFITGSTQENGVYFSSSSAVSNIIGGSLPGEGNVISGNTFYGIYTGASAAAGNTVLGNIIGPQSDGISYVASNAQLYGVSITNSPNNTIGGNTAGARNIISANLSSGVDISGASSTGNVVKGNYIGPGSSLANITGSSQDFGVSLQSGAASGTIGTTVSGEANQIAYNTINGVYLTGTTTTGNKISGNPIYSNVGKPVSLNYGASQGNNGKTKPTIITATPGTVSGTSGAGDIIEIFKNTSGICTDATSFVGTATADGAGNWSLVVALASCDYVLANATDAGNNTSEFSECYLVTGTIATAAIVPTSLCAGVSLNISYSIPCNYNPGNIFTAQLSDVTGSFATPTTIGTLISQAGGIISAEIPSATPAGAFYRIRVISSNPPVNGSDNGANLTISVCSRYWVNGAGNWNDTGNWSATSGGVSGASVPHKGVYVYLDANSFTGPGQIVTLPAGVWYMKSFIPSGVGQQAVIIGQGSMVVGQ